MNINKKTLKVLIISAPDRENRFISKIEKILNIRFECIFKTVNNIEKIPSAFYLLMPHFIIVDPANKEFINRLDARYEYLKQIRSKPFLFINSPDVSESSMIKLDVRDMGFINPGASNKEIENHIVEMAGICGFTVLRGKIKQRLVKKAVRINLIVADYDYNFSGITTGLNKNGLGARLKTSSKNRFKLKHLIDCACEVVFDESDIWFMPVEGKIIRIEESRDSRFDVFFAVAFTKEHVYFDSQELEVLSKFIQKQKDESIVKHIPDPESYFKS
ncbi:MAG: hypothetical protein ACQESB_05235 [Elusimicrobiota bacterium]